MAYGEVNEAWIVGAVRTPIGKHGGTLSSVRPDDLAALVLEEAPRDNPRPVDEAGIRALLEDAYAGRHPGAVTERRA